MSYSLKIVDGDLVTDTGIFQRVSGMDKLTQDLSLWLKEPYGQDRFHPFYGSTLDQYIGSIVNNLAEHEVQAEATRVLNAFQSLQLASMRKNPSKYDMDELLNTVESVEVKINYDAVFVDIRFTTASGLSGRVTGEVSV